MNLQNSVNKSKSEKKEFFIFGEVLVLLEQKLPHLNIDLVCKKIQNNIPKKFFKDLDYIYVGNFIELKTRQVQSAYLRGAIYIQSDNQTEDTLYAAIIHELAHSVESYYYEIIYGDSEIAAEFIGKRKKLRSILKAQNLNFEEPLVYLRQEYNLKFDEFLYKVVGYDRLHQLSIGLFVSPYAITSLREYFANGFEHYYLHDREYVARISPKLFSKISKLTTRRL